ncbi:hypothetical protein [Serratia phage X20]|uniref:DUF7367 domain-containing protein n=3 Tax=Winklervirus TaxID=2560256 RepID=A0A1Z1LYV3_9CAUD|nr:hypothetical protein FDI23_gp003 [Serratia phage CHI14]YP_010092154.1 hypothetical protein KNT72_gp003 [Serratia phage X20]ARW57701.1 hypothetical protein [Serratia phage CBH8]UJJ21987.1 hypothetical protein [Erwinia phage Virsaitis27]ARW57426.1 hypothetical protein [Serratia phage CHI14]ARW57977.1 hypothetical protein [Serratia phage X20]
MWLQMTDEKTLIDVDQLAYVLEHRAKLVLEESKNPDKAKINAFNRMVESVCTSLRNNERIGPNMQVFAIKLLYKHFDNQSTIRAMRQAFAECGKFKSDYVIEHKAVENARL